jgi:hypothetical protein
MILYEYINTNLTRIRHEAAIGLMPCAVLRHWEIYSRYDAYKKMQHSVVMSVLHTATDMHVSESCVFKIIKKMEQNV